ncbi:MAG: hypothetical protein J6S67_03315 [Methanobrevibacter sp.]|nr:hypothetical protein [Methanobrevibacter sp.]
MGEEKNWYQQEFVFAAPEGEKPRKIKVDYELLYEELKKAPLTFSQIKALSGVAHSGVSQIITTLSLHYPVYEVRRGVYKLYGDDDYGDGINHAALENYEDY